MEKILGIIRHGKSTWDYGSVSDLDRPLKESGINNTIDISQKIRKQDMMPDLIISSPAIRALHTAVITARIFNYPYDKILINPLIYEDSKEAILQLIMAVNDEVNCLFIFGHNPVFTSLSNFFLKRPLENVPTSGAVMLTFDVLHWSDISKKTICKESSFFPEKDKF
jgi:phosphohistidine phosphatase